MTRALAALLLFAPLLPAQEPASRAAAPDSTGRLNEFWARRATGVGVFFTRADIERRQPQRTVDLFRGVSGVRVMAGEGITRLVSSRGASSLRAGTGGRSGVCIMQVFLDGLKASTPALSVDELTPEMIEAIEIYRGASEVPARFNTLETACGVVIFWTREPPAPSETRPPPIEGTYLRSPRKRYNLRLPVQLRPWHCVRARPCTARADI